MVAEFRFRAPRPSFDNDIKFDPRLFAEPGAARSVSIDVFYRLLSDTPLRVREVAWQCDDVAPEFPRVLRYVEHWTTLQCVIVDIKVGQCEIGEEDSRSIFAMWTIPGDDYARLVLGHVPRRKTTVAVIPTYGGFVRLQ